MKNATTTIITAILVVLVIAGGLGTVYSYQESQNVKKQADKDQRALERKVNNLKQERDKLKNQALIEDVPEEAFAGHASESGLIIVTKPQIDDLITSPVRVAGKAKAFESTVNIRVKDDQGGILKETSVITNAPDVGEFGDYSTKVDFESSTKKGEIEVFEYSARDGSEVNKVIIPVNFRSE
ncbi:MAG TPA: hypothetical protein ENI11_02675 [Actinobacteria bacterium]|nr:hypothetical protein [Actinomycetota bacterium]